MPYSIRKVRNKNCYQVKNKVSGKLHSKCTTIQKAKLQVQLLIGIENGWKPLANTKRKSSKRKSKRRTGLLYGKKLV